MHCVLKAHARLIVGKFFNLSIGFNFFFFFLNRKYLSKNLKNIWWDADLRHRFNSLNTESRGHRRGAASIKNLEKTNQSSQYYHCKLNDLEFLNDAWKVYIYTHEILFTYLLILFMRYAYYILIFLVLKINILVIKFHFLYVSMKDPSY
jgi:hypothetical protein